MRSLRSFVRLAMLSRAPATKVPAIQPMIAPIAVPIGPSAVPIVASSPVVSALVAAEVAVFAAAFVPSLATFFAILSVANFDARFFAYSRPLLTRG